MTAGPSKIGGVSYELETATTAGWAEAVNTWSTRLMTLGEIRLPADIQDRLAEPITQQRTHEGKMGVRGPWKGSFTTRHALTGHGGTSAGALSATAIYTLLLNIVGGGSLDSAGTTVDAAPTSASEFALVGGTVESGNLIRVGALGDGRGEGQFAAVDNIATTTLLTALGATPDAADVVYANQMIYPLEEDNAPVVASTRWLLQTFNRQLSARGVFPLSISFSGLNVGEMPSFEVTWGVSRWGEETETFPRGSTLAASKDGSVVAAGSCFLQDVGTVTRQTFGIRDWSFSVNLGVVPIFGPGGKDGYQTIVGARRVPSTPPQISITADAEANGTTTLLDIYTGSAMQHLLMSLSVADGKALGFYFPNCRPTKYVPQVSSDGLNRETLTLEALTSETFTSEETSASWKLAMG